VKFLTLRRNSENCTAPFVSLSSDISVSQSPLNASTSQFKWAKRCCSTLRLNLLPQAKCTAVSSPLLLRPPPLAPPASQRSFASGFGRRRLGRFSPSLLALWRSRDTKFTRLSAALISTSTVRSAPPLTTSRTAVTLNQPSPGESRPSTRAPSSSESVSSSASESAHEKGLSVTIDHPVHYAILSKFQKGSDY
jgi:hypothetical protein